MVEMGIAECWVELSETEAMGLLRIAQERPGRLFEWLTMAAAELLSDADCPRLCPAAWTDAELHQSATDAVVLLRVLRDGGQRDPAAMVNAALELILAEIGERLACKN